jgi:hypothetical protein
VAVQGGREGKMTDEMANACASEICIIMSVCSAVIGITIGVSLSLLQYEVRESFRSLVRDMRKNIADEVREYSQRNDKVSMKEVIRVIEGEH